MYLTILLCSLNGLAYGSLLFLLATGISQIFGLMNIINLAHGSYYMFGAYVGLSILKATGSFLLSVLGGGIAVGLIGVVMERFFLRALYKKHLHQVLLTFGFIYIFMDLGKWIWGTSPKMIAAPSILEGSAVFGGAHIPVYRLALIFVALLVGIGLWLFQEKTRFGALVRASVDDQEMAEGISINVSLIFTLVFFFGAFLAGFAGVMGGPIVGAYPGVDSEVLVLAIVIVVIGGLGSLQGAYVGSILIGLIDNFSKAFFPESALFTIFAIMTVILVFRPSGLFGRTNR